MQGQQKVNISELRPSKLIKTADGYEVLSNDGTIKIQLRHTTVMDGSMESDFYHTVMWIMEDGGWLKVNSTQNYRTKEEFIRTIDESEDFTQAMAEFNS